MIASGRTPAIEIEDNESVSKESKQIEFYRFVSENETHFRFFSSFGNTGKSLD
jgi:hypothetical protein